MYNIWISLYVHSLCIYRLRKNKYLYRKVSICVCESASVCTLKVGDLMYLRRGLYYVVYV